MKIILASSSPRRRSLLEELGLDPVVIPADIDERPRANEAAAPYVERLAIEKGAVIDAAPDELVISADTIVALDGELLGKPTNDEQAADFLRRLSGRGHEVMTGIAVRLGDDTVSAVVETMVRFATLSDADIAWYVGTGEATGKAGAYAIQGRGGAFVASINGSHDNVIGLPRHALITLAQRLGVDLIRGTLES